MALTQTRPKDLDIYIQLAPGEEGYISPADLVYIVDHSSFTKPKQISIPLISDHVEKGILTSLSSRSVAVTFSDAFTSTPLDFIEVYREESVGYLRTRRTDVLYYNYGITTTGFTLTIDAEESLNGIVIKYKFEQI
jgi:hypothetical protein